MTTLSSIPTVGRLAAISGLMLTAAACAPATTPQAPLGTTTQTASAPSAPVLLSCPAGEQPLLRQVAVQGVLVPQVECVTTGQSAPLMSAPMLAPVAGPVTAPVSAAAMPAPTVVPVTQTTVPQASAPVPQAPAPVSVRAPAARRVVYDDVEEYRRPTRRTWQKSAVIIGSSAGVGAGVGALTGGKKGALIGAAVGGGAATVWDQVTRRR